MKYLRLFLNEVRIFAEDAFRNFYTPLKFPGERSSRAFVTQKPPH